MSEFKVKISNMKSTVQQQNTIARQMKDLEYEIQKIQNGLSFEIAQKERIRQRLTTARKEIAKEYTGIDKATKALDNSINIYETTEAKLSGAEVPKRTMITNIDSVLPYISDSNSVVTILGGISAGIDWGIDQIASKIKSKTKKSETLFDAKKEKSNILEETYYRKNEKDLEDSKITPFKVLSKKWNYNTSLFHGEEVIGDENGTYVSSSFDILKFKSNAEIYGGLYYIDEQTGEKKLRAAVGAEAGFTLSGFTAEQKLQLGSSFLGAYLTTEETVGRIGANGSFVMGLRDAEGNFNPTAHAKLQAEAILAEISAKGGAKVLGTDIGVKGSVNFGVGAHAEFGLKDGKFSMDIGASLGIGGSVKLDIDFSGTIDAIKGKAKAIWQSFW